MTHCYIPLPVCCLDDYLKVDLPPKLLLAYRSTPLHHLVFVTLTLNPDLDIFSCPDAQICNTW